MTFIAGLSADSWHTAMPIHKSAALFVWLSTFFLRGPLTMLIHLFFGVVFQSNNQRSNRFFCRISGGGAFTLQTTATAAEVAVNTYFTFKKCIIWDIKTKHTHTNMKLQRKREREKERTKSTVKVGVIYQTGSQSMSVDRVHTFWGKIKREREKREREKRNYDCSPSLSLSLFSLLWCALVISARWAWNHHRHQCHCWLVSLWPYACCCCCYHTTADTHTGRHKNEQSADEQTELNRHSVLSACQPARAWSLVSIMSPVLELVPFFLFCSLSFSNL